MMFLTNKNYRKSCPEKNRAAFYLKKLVKFVKKRVFI